MSVMVIHFPEKESCVKCEDPITGEMGYVRIIDGAVCWFCRPKKKTTRQSGPERNNILPIISSWGIKEQPE